MIKIKNYIIGRCERFIKRKSREFGEENIERMMLLADELEQKNKSMRKNRGNFTWLLWCFALIFFLLCVYWRGIEGAIAGIFFSIAIIIVGFSGRQTYCEMVTHLGGINGFNASQNHVRKYAQGGPKHFVVSRSFLMTKWYYFLYSEDGERWSWRIYGLAIAFILLIYLSPMIGLSCLSILLAAFISVFLNLGQGPLALYLGSSNPASQKILEQIIAVSGVRWISLLNDGVELDPEAEDRVENFLNGLTLKIRSNVWSLRCNENVDWRTIVRDFMNVSPIIIVRPENYGPVREEIDFLATLGYPQRIIVIRTDPDCETHLPYPLNKCVMDEQEVFNWISLTASRPRLFRKKIKAREILFEDIN